MTPNDVQAVLDAIAMRVGSSVQQVKKDFWLDPFVFTINFVTPNQLAASATSTLNFVVQNDSAFVICKETFTMLDVNNAAIVNLQPYGSGGASSVVPVLVTQTDSGAGRSLMDSGVPIDSLYGTAQRPFLLSIPKLLDPNSTFSVTLQNLVATAFHVRLAHHGYKVFGNSKQWAERHK